jgi:hypothetical protein
MSLSKLKNWKASVEIDYLALYIKTWFAFLSSVKYLHPDIECNIGDGKVLKHYIENISLPSNFEQEIKRNIQKSYSIGRQIIKRDLSSSFFGKFYSINEGYDFILPQINHVRFRIKYRAKFEGKRNPNLFIEYKSTQRQFNSKFRKYYFSYNIFVKDLINGDLYHSKDAIVDYIIQCLKDNGYTYIENMAALQPIGINQRKAYLDTVLTDISQQWRPLFKAIELFQPLPVPNFPDGYDENAHKLVVLRWFIRFSYDLRNILFHHIIDPFDEEWLKLFKTTYLALKEIVNHNVNLIEQTENIDNESTP